MSSDDVAPRPGVVGRDLRHATTGQAAVLIVSALRTLMIPWMLGGDLHSYARWQAYLLYLGYISLAFLGFNDGLYVRYARLSVAALRARLSSALAVYSIALVCEAALLIGVVWGTKAFGDDTAVWIAVFANLPLAGLYGAMLYHLQLTARIDWASRMLIFEKSLFVLIVVLSFALDRLSLLSLILADVSSRVIVLSVAVVGDRENVFGHRPRVSLGVREFAENIGVGGKIMIGAYSALLAAGVARISVQMYQPPVVFAQFAFAFSVSSLVMVAGQAIGTVLYPYLARQPIETLGRHFTTLSRVISLLFPALLCAYLPIFLMTKIVLPQFVPSLVYVAPLLVATGLQLVISTLNNNYYRLLRLEDRMMRDNLLILAVMVPLCFLLRQHVVVLLVAQVLATAARAWITQRLFSKQMRIAVPRGVLVQLAWSGLFLAATLSGSGWLVLGFTLVVTAFLMTQRTTLRQFALRLRSAT